MAGLSAPVTLIYDRWDVPHLRAASEHDVFIAQGYVAAQDRLWQMLLRRQAARGRLAAWLGPAAAEADALLGGQDFYAGREEKSATSDALEAYTAGVNAYLAQLDGSPPIEFTLLASRGVSISLDPWTVEDSLAVARMIEWAQSLVEPDAQLGDDLLARFGPERAAELLRDEPLYPALPRSPAARQVLGWAAIPLAGSATGYSAPVSPPAWYMIELHSLSYQAAGAAMAGWPGIVATPAGLSGQTPDGTPGAHSDLARRLVPYLVALEPYGWLQRRVTPMMAKWDYRLEANSAPAAVYEAWLVALGRRALADELGPDLHARYAASRREPGALARLAAQPDSAWWDDVTTPPRETRDEIMRLAYADALEYLGRHYGDLHTIWEWGRLHAATFEHALGDAWPASILLNRGPVCLGGDGLTEPPIPFDPSTSFEPVIVPSLMWRVASNGAWSFALAGEQSGAWHIPRGGRLGDWQAGKYSPLLWTEADIEASARRTLTLSP